jgi:hypothetical protein
MTKKEIIWREVLYQSRVHKKNIFTQKKLAEQFGVSLSTVFNALKVPREANIIRMTGRGFTLESYAKLLYLWASSRSLERDMLQKVYAPANVSTLEGSMPPGVVFGLYSAFKIAFKTAPAEYDHLYIYVAEENIPVVMARLNLVDAALKRGTQPNVFLLKQDPRLKEYGREYTPLEQTFVDLWNAPEWYAKDFLSSLKQTLDL